MVRRSLQPLVLLLAACTGGLPSTDEPADGCTANVSAWRDEDGDGFGAGEEKLVCAVVEGLADNARDCDDTDNDINPGDPERCNGIDDDCNGEVDEEGAEDGTAIYDDADADGYGDAGTERLLCEPPAGALVQGGDCDPANPDVNAGAVELCDGLDNDCDGLTDDPNAADAPLWFIDADGDGHGTDAYSERACAAPAGMAPDPYDCDDTDPNTYPGATEYCDRGDDDCDGEVDESDAVDATRYFRDDDGDGYGNPDAPERACEAAEGLVLDDQDCDDTTATVSPAAAEFCDGRDNDCDGDLDEDDAFDAATWYTDVDGDSFGGAGSARKACAAAAGEVGGGGDCDDTDAAVSPLALETCDGTDNDCDGTTDEDDAAGAPSWYADADADGYGDPGVVHAACAQPAGYVGTGDDCDDTSAVVNPAADELCDGLDNNCDGTTDEDSAIDAATWYADADGDAYGDATSPTTACVTPSGFAGNDEDCDDSDATVNPGAPEYCGGADENCDGVVDEDTAADVATWYRDADRDGYGLTTTTDVDCDQPAGYAAASGDCNDASSAISPGDTEICDAAATDEDCDGLADDADPSVSGESHWYTDADGDGYGVGAATLSCAALAGQASADGDCDDAEASVNPGEAETCNDGLDNDCDGLPDPCEWSGSSAPSGADITLAGNSSSDYLGFGLAGGDIDGDGADDLLARWSESPSGWWVYPGSATGTTSAAMTKLVGGGGGSYLSYTAEVGDFDGDGQDDLLVGTTAGGAYGAALFQGPITAGTTLPSADASFLSSAGDYFGYDLAGGFDMDADGNLEVAIGGYYYAYGGTTGVGGVALIESPSGSYTTGTVTALLRGSSKDDYVGDGLAAVDLDGDGAEELLVGASGARRSSSSSYANEGLVYLLSGALPATGTIASAADAVIYGQVTSDDRFGETLEPAGDLDGDGYDDLLAGSSAMVLGSSGYYGGVIVFEGSATLPSTGTWAASAGARFSGPSYADFCSYGDSVAVSDVNGDGEADVLIGGWEYSGTYTDGGGAWLFYGPFSGTYDPGSADWKVLGSGASQEVGHDVVAVGDRDNDGFGDFAVASYAYDSPYSNAGSVWLYHGLGL